MASINPPWRFDPLQMVVNISWVVPSCVVVSVAGQVFYATEPTNWAEFDIPPIDGFYGAKPAVYDVRHQKYWIPDQLVEDGESTSVQMYSATATFKTGWSTPFNFPFPYSPPSSQYFVNTELLNAYGGPNGVPDSGPWSTDGGVTWNEAVPPPDFLQTGLQYPAPSWVDPDTGQTLYVQFNMQFVAEGLYDSDGNFQAPLSSPGGTSQTLQFTAGNGLLLGIFRIGNDSDPPTFVLGVSKDNVNWTTSTSVGEIPSYTFGGISQENDEGEFVPVTVDRYYPNFQFAQIAFAPGWNLFVFSACTADTYSFDWNDTTNAVFTTLVVLPNPLQIYTSPNGISWTKQYQAGWTNGTSPPDVIPKPPTTFVTAFAVTASWTQVSDPVQGTDHGPEQFDPYRCLPLTADFYEREPEVGGYFDVGGTGLNPEGNPIFAKFNAFFPNYIATETFVSTTNLEYNKILEYSGPMTEGGTVTVTAANNDLIIIGGAIPPFYELTNWTVVYTCSDGGTQYTPESGSITDFAMEPQGIAAAFPSGAYPVSSP